MTTFKYENSLGEIVDWPMFGFTKKQLDALDVFLSDKKVMPLIDIINGMGGEGTVAMRHDVDHSIQHALKFAIWEHARGYRSTYFILHSAWYYSDFKNMINMAKSIESMGHEIGFHNDTVGEVIRQHGVNNYHHQLAADLMMHEIDLWSVFDFSLRGCADHGGGYPKEQVEFWHRYKPSDFGFKYEAYHMNRELNVNYISDNRGTWRAPLETVEGKQTLMLAHPCHWPV